MKNNIGLYGLGVMGQSLARNIASRGYKISVFNIDITTTQEVQGKYPELDGYYDIKAFVNSLEKPRKIILMVTAGSVVDEVVNTLIPLLDKGDIIIDCGNSFYKDTERRQEYLKEVGFHFIGCGVSGGEKGALHGPSIMPSGDYEAYTQIQEIFESIAAKNDDGSSCCTYIGKGGAGHFVKMVHNGIEYADMQLIAEYYGMFKKLYKQNKTLICKAFEDLCEDELDSYLLHITCDIMKYKEEDTYLLDYISDVAKQKGTGKWTAQVALDYGVPIPSLLEAVQARFLSSMKEERVIASTYYEQQICVNENEKELYQALKKTMLLAKISIYAQGFSFIKTISDACNYDIDYKGLAVIWQNGCIIKSEFLKCIYEAYNREANLMNLLVSDVLYNRVLNDWKSYQIALNFAVESGIYTPVLTSAYQYINGYTCPYLETNLVQAQRDCFGAHTYRRIDKEGVFHTEWQ